VQALLPHRDQLQLQMPTTILQLAGQKALPQ
jgi:hypothetical protein